MSRNINLYDPALRIRRDVLAFEPAASIVAATLAVIIVGAFAVRWSASNIEPLAAASTKERDDQQNATQLLAAKLAANKPDAKLQARVMDAQRTLLQRRAALATLNGNTPDREGGFSTRLSALARQSVDGLWLTGMVLRQNDVQLKGRAMQPALIPVYVQRLDKEPSLQGHAFKALDVVRPVDKNDKGDKADKADKKAPVDANIDTATVAPLRTEFVEFTLFGSGVPVADMAETREARP